MKEIPNIDVKKVENLKYLHEFDRYIELLSTKVYPFR